MFENGRGLEIVDLALKEDLPSGDVTTDSIFTDDHEPVTARLLTREACVVAGYPAVERILSRFPDITLSPFKGDGDAANPDDVILSLTGNPASILKAERTLLNFLQRLSAVATRTHEVVAMLDGTGIKLLDTRKTAPGMRLLEKHAVRMGGGHNHRTSLSDGVLIKENHIRAAGSITEAVTLCKTAVPHLVRVEVEVENLAELDEALVAGADGVLLDNMSVAEMKAACERKSQYTFFIEVSGGITANRIAELKTLPIDYISMGAVTHSAGIIDMTLLF